MTDGSRRALQPYLMEESDSGKRKSRRLIPIAGALVVAALLFRPLRRLFLHLVSGALLALAARPLCAFYEKRLPRGLSALLALLTLLGAMIGTVALFVPPLIRQFQTAGELAPTILEWLEQALSRLQQTPLLRQASLSVPDPGALLRRAGEWLTQRLPALLRGLMGTVDKLSGVLIVPVTGYYFLRDRELFCYQLSLLIPCRYRGRMLEAMQDIRRETGAYVRGQLLIALCVGALTGLGLFLIGVPAFMVLGLVMGVCEVIPYIGPILGGIPIVLFALSQGRGTVLWALALTVAVQQLEGLIIAPHMMAGTTGLHPVYVLLLLTAGSMLFGVWGLLFSIPVFLCLRSLGRVFLSGRGGGA